MVEFEYQPWKKIIIHEVVKYPLEFFIFNHSVGVQEGGTGSPLSWAHGVAFEISTIPPVEEVVKEQVKGIIHWSFLHYADMPEYKSELIGPRSVNVPIVDLSNHYVFSAMAKWIKEQHEKLEQ